MKKKLRLSRHPLSKNIFQLLLREQMIKLWVLER